MGNGGGHGCFCERVPEKKFSKVGSDFYKGRYLYIGFIQKKRTGGGGVFIYKRPVQKNFLKKFLKYLLKEIIKIKCLETAKKCKTKYEFRTNYRSEYYSARDNGWLKSYIWLESCKGIKDEEKKNKAIEVARQCITKREFREEHPVEYALAVKYKILKEFTWLKGCKKMDSK